MFFKPYTLKIIAYICLTGSIIGFAFTTYDAIPFKKMEDYLVPASWFFMILTSYWEVRIVQRYMYADNFKTVGWYIYLTLLLLILFVVVKLFIGVLPVLFLAFGLNNRNVEINEKIKRQKNT